jgi:hypothetical protein
MSKQTYAFAGLAIIGWLFLSTSVLSRTEAKRFLARSAIFVACALVPFFLFWESFAYRGRSSEYLASFFLYPMVYGIKDGHEVANFIRHLLTVAAGFSDQLLLVLLACGAALASAMPAPSLRPQARGWPDPRWLVLFVLASLIAAVGAAPTYFSYHFVMVLGPMALLAGIALGDFWEAVGDPRPQRAFCGALALILTGTMLIAAETWRSNAKLAEAKQGPWTANVPGASPGDYAYQLGELPDFYARNKFIPASTVQFAWALPGALDNWAYTRPAPDTRLRAVLDRAQARNLSALLDDFARTPPHYILLQDDYVRSRDDASVVAIPGLQAYVDKHCRLISKHGPAPPSSTHGPAPPSTLYACGPSSPAYLAASDGD